MRLLRNQQGFALPVIILLMSLMAITAYTVLSQSTNSLTLSYRQAYLQMARVASKAAIDYAQEQFDNSNCGNYSGTTEQNLVSNARYRLTFKADVISTAPDGLSKIVQGTGSVYLPKNSVSARYVFSVKSEIINTFATCKTPADYSPLIWLDASDTPTLQTVTSGLSSVNYTTAFGNAADSTRDTLEERADNGSQTNASWQSNDFQMHVCSSAEFSNAICSSNATKYLNIGMIYSNVTVPKNAVITSANISLACTTPSGAGGLALHRIFGIYKTASNPHPNLFTVGGSNQLKAPLSTNGLHTAAYSDVSENNCPPGNSVNYNVSNVVQEMVNNANWDPSGAGNGGRVGFAIQYIGGSGSRHLLKGGNKLTISYIATSVGQANNTNPVNLWLDKSGNANNAVATFGNAPTRQDNQINAKPVVRFNNGAMLSPLVTSLVNNRELTTFAVIKPNFGTSANDGRIISATNTSATDDLALSKSTIPLMRYAGNSGISSSYSGSGAAYRLNYTCGASCSSLPSVFSNIFDTNSPTTMNSYLRFKGAQVGELDAINPSGSPYTFSVNQFYFGGTRTGSGVGSGTNYMNGDYAELVVYDHALTCYQAESLEDYFRIKWGLAASNFTDTCPPPTVPTL